MRKLMVFNSITIETATWNNTRVATGDIAAEVRRMKAAPAPHPTRRPFKNGCIVVTYEPAT